MTLQTMTVKLCIEAIPSAINEIEGVKEKKSKIKLALEKIYKYNRFSIDFFVRPPLGDRNVFAGDLKYYCEPLYFLICTSV